MQSTCSHKNKVWHTWHITCFFAQYSGRYTRTGCECNRILTPGISTRSSLTPWVTAVALVRMLRCIFTSAIFAFEHYMLRSRGLGLAFQFGIHCCWLGTVGLVWAKIALGKNFKTYKRTCRYKFFKPLTESAKTCYEFRRKCASSAISTSNNSNNWNKLKSQTTLEKKVKSQYAAYEVARQHRNLDSWDCGIYSCMHSSVFSEYEIKFCVLVSCRGASVHVTCWSCFSAQLRELPEAETNTGRRRDVKVRKLFTSNMPKCMRNEFPMPLVLWIEEFTVAMFWCYFRIWTSPGCPRFVQGRCWKMAHLNCWSCLSPQLRATCTCYARIEIPYLAWTTEMVSAHGTAW